ncbi:MAG: DoxX family protein [Acidimicrobiales bacterium]
MSPALVEDSPAHLPEESAGRRRSRLGLASGLLASSVAHFIIPRQFMKIVPRQLGHARFWVYASGVVEAVSGAMMLSSNPATRRRGGVLAAATVVGVYPANIQMALDAGPPRSLRTWGPWLRLPLQVPMVVSAVRVARR